MTIRNLRIFIAVCREENITHASERLNITQPTVTRAVQELEAFYGIKLFDRIKGRLSITESGKEFYERALHIVDSFDELEKVMKDWDTAGVLRVGASITLGSMLLPEAVSSFRRSHPAMRVKTMVSNGATLQDALIENRIDFALIEGGEIRSSLRKEAIRKDRLIPVLPPGDPRRGGETDLGSLISSSSLLTRERGSASRTCLGLILALHGLTPDPDMVSSSNNAIIEAVHSGLGISFLPEDLVKRHVDSGYVSTLKVTDEDFIRENFIVWHPQKFLSKSAKELIEEIKALAE